jgi:aflatoxin B1 aldehyde reductase
VGGGFFTGRYMSVDDVVEEGSRFDDNGLQGKVSNGFKFNRGVITRQIVDLDTNRCIEPGEPLVLSEINNFHPFNRRYWKEPYFKALASVKDVADKHKLTMPEVALRWMTHHCQLKREYGDSILIGASSLPHIKQVNHNSPHHKSKQTQLILSESHRLGERPPS